MNEIEIKNLIIGSGPGGAIVANELTLNKHECGIVEEGDDLSVEDDLIDNNIFKIGDELKNKWRNGGAQFAFGKHPISFSEACCYGGGSEINSGIYQEASSEVLNKWAIKYDIKDLDIIENLNNGVAPADIVANVGSEALYGLEYGGGYIFHFDENDYAYINLNT